MKSLKKMILVLAIFIGLNFFLMGINIIQKGGKYDGRSIEQILGKPPEIANVEDIKRLSKSEIMQLFYAASPPEFTSMNGEYKAQTLSVGIMSPVVDYFTHHFFGPGRWEGKAFFPKEKNKGWGYNMFSLKDGNNGITLVRTRKMETWITKSEIDDKDSFHLVYRAYNGGLVKSMHDEIRKINNTLYMGMGYMAAGGGSINPAPFILYGMPSALSAETKYKQ